MIKNIKKYPEISLSEERHLIAQAQKGSSKSKDELLLRHIKFLIHRIHRIVFPDFLRRFREDLLSEGVLTLNAKIHTYDLRYRDKKGESRPVRFKSYVWKRIDGFIIDYFKKETIYQQYRDNFSHEKNLSENLRLSDGCAIGGLWRR